jgi:hypothetical protein
MPNGNGIQSSHTTPAKPKTQAKKKEDPPVTPTPETADWKWEMEDLSKGSLWYRARMRSLRKAIKEAKLTNEK